MPASNPAAGAGTIAATRLTHVQGVVLQGPADPGPELDFEIYYPTNSEAVPRWRTIFEESAGPTQATLVAVLRSSASVRCNVSTKVTSCGAYFSDATSRAVMERQPTGRLPTTSCIWPKA